MTEEKQIVETTTSLIIPMVPIEQLKALTAYVNEVKKTLMVKDKDYVISWDGNQYTARSGYAKLAQGFTLSDEEPIVKKLLMIDVTGEESQEFTFKHMIKKEWKTRTFTTKIYGFEAYVKVINVDTGRFSYGEGACSVEELDWTNNLDTKWYHRCLGTAKTRAWNRAVSNYVGSADVSAEEMGLRYEDESPPPRQAEAEVKIVEFMTPQGLKLPEWLPADEINRDTGHWDTAHEIVEQWMTQAGFKVEDWTIKVDTIKVSVKPVKAIPIDRLGEVNGILLAAGFTLTRASDYRLNRKDIVG